MIKIEELKTSDLIPYKNNPRKNENAVDAVAESIRQFGFKVPIIIDKNNVIVAGHTRLKAAEKIGLEMVPIIRADDLNEEQLAAFRLADNKTGELAEWDFEKLREELSGIQSIKMQEFGFTESDEINYSDYFNDSVEEEKQVKTITCPNCGQTFEVEV